MIWRKSLEQREHVLNTRKSRNIEIKMKGKAGRAGKESMSLSELR